MRIADELAHSGDLTPRVVIIGGGFAGLAAARALKTAPVKVVLFDQRNHYLFQPLLYQVATAALAAPDVAAPIRQLLARQANTTVLLRAVERVELAQKAVHFDGGKVHYDFLILAAGAVNHYFGHDAWEAWAPGLKSIDDAFEIRRRVLGAFEEAELEADPERRKKLLTFAVVGGGATGVELAGALAEIATRTLTAQYRHFRPADAKVILVEGGASLLPGFPDVLRQKAKARLEHLGVEVRLGSRVTGIDGEGVRVEAPAGAAPDPSGAAAGGPGGLGGLIEARTVLWGAGVRASPLAKSLGVPLDRGGRVEVSTTLHPPGHDEVFVCGDIAAIPWIKRSGAPATTPATTVPGVAQGGIQSGRYAARMIRRRLAGKPPTPFAYFDKGTLATIGRASAVAQLGRWKFSGFFAWLLWVFIHIMYLASFRNRIIVLIQWTWAFITWNRPSRIILERPARWPPSDGPPPAAKP